MIHRHPGGLRAAVADEAARLMYEEGVKQYFTAKRIATKRLFGRVGGRRMRYRPSDLPSNGEIREALLARAELAEGDRRLLRLFAMRVVALETMRALGRFEPRLIGSVSTGHIRRGSDIDLHVFADDPDALFELLRGLRWTFETERVSIMKGGAVREFLHVHVADVFAIELTVYPRAEMRVRPRSSTDGKPIERVAPLALEERIAREHPEAWALYQREGAVRGLDALLDAEEGPPGSAWDGLINAAPEIPAECESGLADEEADEDPYDPLPGFESL